ncbi:MAG TPA: hypothetical protein VMT30_05735 [Candidatus Saccharimonadia bacterium]|nr:hypothetical protein [Candidatus Saccharimonadia bacterium]
MEHDHILETALSELGLTPNAIRLYLQSSRMGRMTVGRLAVLCEMDRSSAHLAAGQLRAAGLLEELADGGRQLVWVRPPRELLTRLRLGIRKLRTHYDAVEDALPRLEASYQEKGTVPALQVFSGKDGLRQVVANIMANAEGEILLMTNQESERRVFTRQDHQEFIRERLRRRLAIRVLALDTPAGHELAKTDGVNLRQTRVIRDGGATPFLSETYIYGDCVAMLSFHDVAMGFVVRSTDFAGTQRWLFERLWRECD